jgi:hypothetical protein
MRLVEYREGAQSGKDSPVDTWTEERKVDIEEFYSDWYATNI